MIKISKKHLYLVLGLLTIISLSIIAIFSIKTIQTKQDKEHPLNFSWINNSDILLLDDTQALKQKKISNPFAKTQILQSNVADFFTDKQNYIIALNDGAIGNARHFTLHDLKQKTQGQYLHNPFPASAFDVQNGQILLEKSYMKGKHILAFYSLSEKKETKTIEFTIDSKWVVNSIKWNGSEYALLGVSVPNRDIEDIFDQYLILNLTTSEVNDRLKEFGNMYNYALQNATLVFSAEKGNFIYSFTDNTSNKIENENIIAGLYKNYFNPINDNSILITRINKDLEMEIDIFNLKDQQLTKLYAKKYKQPYTLAMPQISPDHKYLAFIDDDQTLKVININPQLVK